MIGTRDAAAGHGDLTRLGLQVREAVARLELDLSGLTVVTEAATGPYVVTPVLAALAGAQVLALTRPSRYGSVAEVRAQTLGLLRAAGVDEDRVQVVEEITPAMVGKADVITNSGHLRPLDASMLQHARESVVIPLMYEAWECRDGDVDLDYVRSRGIRLGATNERHPDVGVFDYLGEMAVKLIHDAGLSLRNNRFVLAVNNDFGPYIAETLVDLCAGLAVVDRDDHESRYSHLKVDWVGGFPRLDVPPAYDGCAAMILAAYPFEHTWIGKDTEMNLHGWAGADTRPLVLRYAGDVDGAVLAEAGVRYYPAEVPSGHMGVLPSAIGDDPIVRLQAGGLKSAEALLSGQHQLRGQPVVELF